METGIPGAFGSGLWLTRREIAKSKLSIDHPGALFFESKPTNEEQPARLVIDKHEFNQEDSR